MLAIQGTSWFSEEHILVFRGHLAFQTKPSHSKITPITTPQTSLDKTPQHLNTHNKNIKIHTPKLTNQTPKPRRSTQTKNNSRKTPTPTKILELKENGVLNSPQIQNPHPILQLSLDNIALQHGYLGLAQGFSSGWVETGRVFHSGTETGAEDAGGDFVVLGVCCCGFDCYWAAAGEGGRLVGLVGIENVSGVYILPPQQLHISHLPHICLFQTRTLDISDPVG